MTNPQYNDDIDHTNDDGYYEYADTSEIRDEWLREEEEFFSERELDPADESEYDVADGEENGETADSIDRYDEDFDWDDETPIGLEYDGYNDADNY